MAKMNKTNLIGRLGSLPKAGQFPNGDWYCNFSIASDDGYKDRQTGQYVEDTNWHAITCTGRLAEYYKDKLVVGAEYLVEGSLRTKKGTGDKASHTFVTIKASSIQVTKEAPVRDPQQQGGQHQAYNRAPQAAAPQQQPAYAQAPQQKPAYAQAPQQAPAYSQAPQQAAHAAQPINNIPQDDEVPI